MAADSSLTVPSKAFTFTMKTKALGADHYEAMEAMRGDRDRWGSNSRLAYAIYTRYLAANLITSWDRTVTVEKVDGAGIGYMDTVPMAITAETVASIEDHADYEFVINAAISRVQLRAEDDEANFKLPSTPSTKGTTSSRKTSRRSRS